MPRAIFGIDTVKGKFNEFAGKLVMNRNALKGSGGDHSVAACLEQTDQRPRPVTRALVSKRRRSPIARYGIKSNDLLESGVSAVGDKIEIEIVG